VEAQAFGQSGAFRSRLKLSVDSEALGYPQENFMYVFSGLEKLTWKNTGTFLKPRRNTGEPQALLDYLEHIYGNPNIKARAARRLHQIGHLIVS
jgi:hypothetical protein